MAKIISAPSTWQILLIAGVIGALVALLAILLMRDTWGPPGSRDYLLYEAFNRLMGILLLLQIGALIGFRQHFNAQLGRPGRVAMLLAIMAWLGMAIGTAAEFWLYSDLSYADQNMRQVAFSVFSFSSLVSNIALIILGIDLLRRHVIPRLFAILFMLFLPLDILLFIGGWSPFISPALAALLCAGLTRRQMPYKPA